MWTSDVPIEKKALVNYGDVKAIANKVWWKYLTQDMVNLLVGGTDQPYFKQKQKNNITKCWLTGLFLI